MPVVRPVSPDEFASVAPLLRAFENPWMRDDDWRRMLFEPPWKIDEPERGYALVEGSEVVGFLGTLFSARTIRGTVRRFCNLSSWIVRPDHRTSSLALIAPVLAMKAHTIVNLSASPAAHRIFTTLGFETLEDHQLLLPPVASLGEPLRWPGVRVLGDPDRIVAALEGEARRIAADTRGTLAAMALMASGVRRSLVVATRSPWKPGRCLAHVQYASDWDLFWRAPGLVAREFHRSLGAFGLRVDGRWAAGRRPSLAKRRALELPTLYRPASADLAPRDVDGLYSEALGQRWSA